MPAFEYGPGDHTDIEGDFKLTHYLSRKRSNYITRTVQGNCTDVAYLLLVLCNSLGPAVTTLIIDDPSLARERFWYDTINQIGLSGLTGGKRKQRWWNYHHVVEFKGLVSDASLMLAAPTDGIPATARPILPIDMNYATYRQRLWYYKGLGENVFKRHRTHVPDVY